MRVRKHIGLLAISAVALSGAFLIWYARPLVPAHRIGIPWTYTLAASGCQRGRGMTSCNTRSPRSGRTSGTSLLYTAATRELLRADRTWILSDSLIWMGIIDSTRRAFAGWGLQALPCDPTATHFPVAEAWRLGNRELRLYAAPRVPSDMGVRRYVSVQIVAFGAFGCGARYYRRLLTRAEIARAAHDWLVKQIGLQ